MEGSVPSWKDLYPDSYPFGTRPAIHRLTGWAWHTLAISSAEAPYSIASTASLISSPAVCSHMCARVCELGGSVTCGADSVILCDVLWNVTYRADDMDS